MSWPMWRTLECAGSNLVIGREGRVILPAATRGRASSECWALQLTIV